MLYSQPGAQCLAGVLTGIYYSRAISKLTTEGKGSFSLKLAVAPEFCLVYYGVLRNALT